MPVTPETAAKRFTILKDHVFAAATLLQNHEATILAALQADDTTRKELDQLGSDLFELLEVIVEDK